MFDFFVEPLYNPCVMASNAMWLIVQLRPFFFAVLLGIVEAWTTSEYCNASWHGTDSSLCSRQVLQWEKDRQIDLAKLYCLSIKVKRHNPKIKHWPHVTVSSSCFLFILPHYNIFKHNVTHWNISTPWNIRLKYFNII